MEYEQQEIKPLLDDLTTEFYKIKIYSNNKETKFLNISREILISLYNSFN